MIIGMTGTIGAGKGTVVRFLKEKGFEHYSVRDYLNDELTKKGFSLNRDNQVKIANEIRKANFPSFIIGQLYERAKEKGRDCVIESIRTPLEAEKIKKEKGILLSVDAKPERRYSRILLRQSENDNISFEEFLENEKREMFSINPHEQNLSECIRMSDFKLDNDNDMNYLKKQVEEILKKIRFNETSESREKRIKKIAEIEEKPTLSFLKKETEKRPSWDEYFMNITRAISERATCDRGKTAAIAVKDKRIIATGYVGSPIGLPHCDEEGHLFHKVIYEDNSISQHCIRTVHAEQNVICQAARYGIPLEGATLYLKMTPCFTCAKMIINAGIKRVVAEKKYHKDRYSLSFLKNAGIIVDILNNEIEKYENM